MRAPLDTQAVQALHVAAEVYPLVKTGGLADVVGALPRALVAEGADVRLVLPGLPSVLQALQSPTVVAQFGPAFGAAKVSLLRGELPSNGVLAYAIDAPYLYQRDGGPYQAPSGEPWSDNLQRFALLGWVAAQLAAGALDGDWAPTVVHAHDWHAGMACAYLQAHPGHSVGTVFTVHNLAFQGLFPQADFGLLGLPSAYQHANGLEFHGQLSFMKAGLHTATQVTTVSPGYAREIATHEFGCGMDGVIRARKTDVIGILNGVDDTVWNPATDAYIASPFDAKAMAGKARCKSALQQELGLAARPDALLFGVVSRLSAQKGLDLILGALPALVAHGAQLALEGTGEPALEAAFAAAAAAHPNAVAVRVGYDEGLAHRIIAGADSVLVPSRFEPCGLTQLYGLRYGSLPLVRRVGGLADTVVDADRPTSQPGDASGPGGTGFVFDAPTCLDLEAAITRVVAAHQTPERWQSLQQRAMAQDFSWQGSAKATLALYRSMQTAHIA